MRNLFSEGFEDYEQRSPAGRRHLLDWVNPNSAVLQTEQESPYGFSEYFLWRDDKVRPAGPEDISAKCAPGVHGNYSDRMEQANRSRYLSAIEACGSEGLGRYPSQEKMGQFLTAYFGKPTTAHAMARGCNISSGYPYWIVWFSHTESGQTTNSGDTDA